ncbi:hypothetical protein WH47_00677 [Habropoda laboriosa]|uniref:Uncharacterized protein n=1 Tax=Habropoda laboriosa TaxID=597456 RepID=A0A0L7R477_9HYME|nr:hypothetical protein WH47_00677 [Habropoda laboriosa]
MGSSFKLYIELPECYNCVECRDVGETEVCSQNVVGGRYCVRFCLVISVKGVVSGPPYPNRKPVPGSSVPTNGGSSRMEASRLHEALGAVRWKHIEELHVSQECVVPTNGGSSGMEASRLHEALGAVRWKHIEELHVSQECVRQNNEKSRIIMRIWLFVLTIGQLVDGEREWFQFPMNFPLFDGDTLDEGKKIVILKHEEEEEEKERPRKRRKRKRRREGRGRGRGGRGRGGEAEEEEERPRKRGRGGEAEEERPRKRDRGREAEEERPRNRRRVLQCILVYKITRSRSPVTFEGLSGPRVTRFAWRTAKATTLHARLSGLNAFHLCYVSLEYCGIRPDNAELPNVFLDVFSIECASSVKTSVLYSTEPSTPDVVVVRYGRRRAIIAFGGPCDTGPNASPLEPSLLGNRGPTSVPRGIPLSTALSRHCSTVPPMPCGSATHSSCRSCVAVLGTEHIHQMINNVSLECKLLITSTNVTKYPPNKHVLTFNSDSPNKAFPSPSRFAGPPGRTVSPNHHNLP